MYESKGVSIKPVKERVRTSLHHEIKFIIPILNDLSLAQFETLSPIFRWFLHHSNVINDYYRVPIFVPINFPYINNNCIIH